MSQLPSEMGTDARASGRLLACCRNRYPFDSRLPCSLVLYTCITIWVKNKKNYFREDDAATESAGRICGLYPCGRPNANGKASQVGMGVQKRSVVTVQLGH